MSVINFPQKKNIVPKVFPQEETMELDNTLSIKIDEMTAFFQGLKENPIRGPLFHEQCNLVRGYSNEELIDALRQGDPYSWSTKPNFYHAVVEEVCVREL